MSSEDKLIESLGLIAGGLRKRNVDLAARTIEQAASELSRRASRIEELEKALDPSNDWLLACAERWAWPKDEATVKALALDFKSAFHDARQALSDHPDKEGGK